MVEDHGCDPGAGRIMAEPILSIKNLKTYFRTDEGIVKAVDDVTLEVR